MTRRIASVLGAVILASCATSFNTMKVALPRLVGQPITEAIKYLGIPDGQYDIAGMKVYVWDSTMTHTSVTPSQSTTSGMIGRTPIQASTTTYQTQESTLSCRVKLSTVADQIKNWEYDGNNGACFKYSERLKALAH